MVKIYSENTKKRLNTYLTLFLFGFIFFHSSLEKAQNTDASGNQAVMYVSEGASIYGAEQIEHAKIVYLKNKPKSETKKSPVTKRQKIAKEKPKQLDAPKKKVRNFKKIESEQIVCNPFSRDSSRFSTFSKNISIGAPNNIQQFSKFIATVVKVFSVDKDFKLRKTIFSYCQEKQLLNFSNIFNVRPPPFV